MAPSPTEQLPNPEPLPPWRPLLRAAQQREGSEPMARWLQLARVATDGSPLGRTLVFQGWGVASQLKPLKDGRSAKLAERQANPGVELAGCCLDPLQIPPAGPSADRARRTRQRRTSLPLAGAHPRRPGPVGMASRG